MPVPPVSRMTKDQLVKLSKTYCRHGMPYLLHYNCFLKENPDGIKKSCVFDIEASNLKGNIGILLCYKVLDLSNEEIKGRVISRKEVLSKDCDKQLVKECIKHISEYDQIIGYYSSGFDLKFIRTRAIIHQLDFPAYGSILSKDLYYIIKQRFSLHSNRLEVACDSLLPGGSTKTKFDTFAWFRAGQGDKKSLKYIDEHCEADVKDTAALYRIIEKFSLDSKASI